MAHPILEQPRLLPAGYMAKFVENASPTLELPGVVDLYSVSGCISRPFCEYAAEGWHNELGMFDRPKLICEMAERRGIELSATTLFYYEVHDLQFDGKEWTSFLKDADRIGRGVVPPAVARMEGWDIVSHSVGDLPECSPLSCNSLAYGLKVNEHCLFASAREAIEAPMSGVFEDAEPGPYRLYCVYSVPWR